MDDEVLLHKSLLHRCRGWSMGWFVTENGHGNLQNFIHPPRNGITDCVKKTQ